jgi:hypothetical protein
MRKFAIRFCTLAVYATAAVAVPMAVSAKAAAESTQIKKKHKKINPESSGNAAPRVTNQIPRNYSDDPDRRAAGGGY